MSLTLPAPVAAAATLTLDPASGVPSSAVDATGTDFPENSPISILWDGAVIKSVPAVTGAAFVIEFHVPSDAAVGSHEVIMCVTDSDPSGCGPATATATFMVVLAATPRPTATIQPSTALPTRTGPASSPSAPQPPIRIAEAPAAPSSVLPMVLAALGVGVAGAGLFVVRNRRMAAAAKRAAEPGAWRRRR